MAIHQSFLRNTTDKVNLGTEISTTKQLSENVAQQRMCKIFVADPNLVPRSPTVSDRVRSGYEIKPIHLILWDSIQ